MAVKRIVTNIATDNIKLAKQFYSELLGLEIIMDLDWIVTYANDSLSPVQISIASEGGSGTDVPDLSIEVDNLDEVYAKAAKSHFNVEYELTTEPWGVRRFYIRDPFGRLINILEHV